MASLSTSPACHFLEPSYVIINYKMAASSPTCRNQVKQIQVRFPTFPLPPAAFLHLPQCVSIRVQQIKQPVRCGLLAKWLIHGLPTRQHAPSRLPTESNYVARFPLPFPPLSTSLLALHNCNCSLPQSIGKLNYCSSLPASFRGCQLVYGVLNIFHLTEYWETIEIGSILVLEELKEIFT